MEYHDLTPAQQNIAYLQSFYADTNISVLCGAIIFGEKLDTAIVMRALSAAVRRHEALRLRFRTMNGRTVQFVSGEAPSTFAYMAFTSEESMRSYCRSQAKIPFETYGGKMYRLTVFDLPGRTGIMLCASHLIADAWTYSILAKDVYDIYCRLINGEEPESEEFRFTDSVSAAKAYLSSQRYAFDRDYWSNRAATWEVSSPARYSAAGTGSIAAERYSYELGQELSAAVNAFCAGNGISEAALFESAVLLYLMRINNTRQAVIGVPVLGRSSAHEKKTAGLYISAIPLAVEAPENATALSLCRKTFAMHREVFRHRRFPYSEIQRAIREKTGTEGRLFDVLVSFQNSHTDVPAVTEWFSNGYSEVPFALHIDDRDSMGNYTLTADCQQEVFPDSREAVLLAERIIHIVKQMVAGGDTPLEDISILPQKEREMLIANSAKTKTFFRKTACIQQLFSETAARRPEDTAIVFHGEKFSYRRLDEMSDALAAYLLRRGITTGSVVPIMSRRDPFMIIAMLGVLKSGAAYMPVSPDFPYERRKYMAESIGARLALTCGCKFEGIEDISLESFDHTAPYEKPEVKNAPEDLCYVIFTSGSTGRPKGTMVTHRNVANYCAANGHNVCGRIINGQKSIVSVTDMVFDIFVTESIMALLNGITIILADDEQAVSQHALSRLVTETGAEVIQTTPTKLRSFLFDKNDLSFLSVINTVILGGEELPASLVREVRKYTNAKIYNVYGPAETTVWSTAAEADEKDLTVGSPIANTGIYILDEKCGLLPYGAAGEICISGEGVSKGYLNEPALTAERFITVPFCEGRLYLTGDLGIMRCDGNIDFRGRKDGQIKLRGLRIEPGEIECAMYSFGGIDHAAAVCRKDPDGEQLIAGYYTSAVPVDEQELRRFLLAKLPEYMVPKCFVRLENMPLTQSGKTDRKALPAPKALSSGEYVPPANETEAKLCRIMARVLRQPRIGRGDDFFENGGDSFSAIETAAAFHAEGFEIPVSAIYEHRTAAKLCASLSEKESLLWEQDTAEDKREKYRRYPMKRTAKDLVFFDAFKKLTETLYRFDVRGLENITPGEKYIICPNHESDLDCMWVWAALSGKASLAETCALIAEEHLEDPLKRFIFRVSGGIPLDRRGDFVPSINRAAAVLRKYKRLLLIHPEGTRTRSGKLGEFKKGAAMIAIKTGVSIIPVCITGSRRIYPVTERYPHIFDVSRLGRYPLRISFGKPVPPQGRTPEQLTAEIRRQIVLMKQGKDPAQ